MKQKMISADSPIGVFDSGIGGLTVLKSLMLQFPSEHFVYLGDTARLPYGTKSADTIIKYSLKACAFLDQLNVKSIVVACHTASTCSIPALREAFPHLVIEGMVDASAQRAVELTPQGSILIFGTEATVNSQRYNAVIRSLNPNIPVLSQSCSLLVSLAEENWITGEVPEKVVHHYFDLVQNKYPDHSITSLILACTHFPVLLETIRKVLPESIKLIDPGVQVSYQLYKRLLKKELLFSNNKNLESVKFLVTDNKERFKKVASYFLNLEKPVETFPVELVSLEKIEVL